MSDSLPKEASSRALREVLDELHAALQASVDLDCEAREALARTAREIRESLDRGERPEAEWHSVRRRLAVAIERFEESHPRLTEIVGRVAEALSELGI